MCVLFIPIFLALNLIPIVSCSLRWTYISGMGLCIRVSSCAAASEQVRGARSLTWYCIVLFVLQVYD